MAIRKSISKKLRFEVFKRDFFKCQYCGSLPPNVVLEVDHITSVYNNGTNHIDNLITACFDCNRGKGKHSLNDHIIPLIDKSSELKEKINQYKAYLKLKSEMELLLSFDINEVVGIYEGEFEGWTLSERFKMTSLKKFISELGMEEVASAMWIACSKVFDADKVIKYFCGICWSKIRERR